MKQLRILLSIGLIVVLCTSLAACGLVSSLMDAAKEKVMGVVEDVLEEVLRRTEERSDVDVQSGDAVLAEGDLSFHFLTLGNKYTGDSTYVKIGDVDILIDAGSRTNSAATIIEYVNRYCTDGKLEYVIATHAHQDHIAGFVGNKDASVMRAFEIGTIIEFARTNATSTVYKNYCSVRDDAVERGAKAYTALQCWNNTDGAQRTYTLAPDVSMQVLYNYYYDHDSTDENNYSVCVMFNYGDNHYLFTGDLEKEGEAYLVDNNQLPHCKLFKGGHHGSYTANTAKLMQTIQPDVVCVCCCCGTPEYTTVADNMFPSQAFFNNVLPFTDQIYVTSMVADFDEEALANGDDDPSYSFTDMNGNIVVVANGDQMTVTCSASTTAVPYSDWFAAHRKWPQGGE